MFETARKRKRYGKRFEVSAAKAAPSDETTARELSEGPGVKGPTLWRRACEHEEMGDGAFPGSGGPEVDEGHGTAEPERKAGEPERENELLKNLRALPNQGHARGSGSSRCIGTSSAPSGRPANR